MDIPPELLAAQSALIPLVMDIQGVRGADIGLREENGVTTEQIDFIGRPAAGGDPDERFGMGFVVLQVGLDGDFEIGDAAEDAALDSVLSDDLGDRRRTEGESA